MEVNLFEGFVEIVAGLVESLKCWDFVRLVQDGSVVQGYLTIAHGRTWWTIMSSIEDLIYGVVLLFMDVSSSSGQYSGINLRSWLWTSHLDEMEMDYFPLLYQLPLCSKGRPGHCRDFNKISLFRTPRVTKLLVGQLRRSRFLKSSPRVDLWVVSVASSTLLLGPINSAFSFMPLTFFFILSSANSSKIFV